MTASLTDCVVAAGYYSLEEGCGYLALVMRLAKVTLVAQPAAEPARFVTLRAVAAGFEWARYGH